MKKILVISAFLFFASGCSLFDTLPPRNFGTGDDPNPSVICPNGAQQITANICDCGGDIYDSSLNVCVSLSDDEDDLLLLLGAI